MVTAVETLFAGGLGFAFSLCAKPEEFAGISIAHFWMDTRSIYGQRNTPAVNLRPMADYFWMRCLLERRHTHPAQQEIYLLALLCPHVRSHGGNRVVAESRARRSASTKREQVDALEALLKTSPRTRKGESDQLTMQQFHQRTEAILGSSYGVAELAAYREICAELFDDTLRRTMEVRMPDEALALARWNSLNNRFGRRSRRPHLRKALDVLSHEARAAVRRCYSCVWNDLIPQVASERNLPKASIQFLKLMHLEHILPPHVGADTEPPTNLFRGHVLSLHPATGLLLQTPTGRRLMGEYLAGETAEECLAPFQRLLRAVEISLYAYTGHRADMRRLKRPQDAGLDIEDLDARSRPDDDAD
jgi:hypothetical protein